MITEEEAKRKWCPFARIEDGNGSHNRESARLSGVPSMAFASECMGSQCMAWRWRGWVNLTADGSMEPDIVMGGPLVMTNGPTENKHGCIHVGYCGLAGKP